MLKAYSFDDVLLVPQHGILESRQDADIHTWLIPGKKIRCPIISANMPAVTGVEMVAAMHMFGGYSVLPRIDVDVVALYEYIWWSHGFNPVISIGLKDKDIYNHLSAANEHAIFCLDVAHGDTDVVFKFIEKLPHPEKLIVGNIATGSAAQSLANLGVGAVKVGIGPGAACTTREVTGFGVPQLTAINNVATARKFGENYFCIIADGGIRNSGDIVKALAAGADTVMVGSLLAGCDEAPKPGEYYGNASRRVNGHNAPEGVNGTVSLTGPARGLLKNLCWGIKSGISYAGASDIAGLRRMAVFMEVTEAGNRESRARLETTY